MIPKLIHLFWFGGNEKSALIKRCIESWRTFAPEYRIMKWDEANFDVNFCRRSRQAYEAGKYAFVADIARLKVLYEQGGIYLDTDVELTAPLDELISQTRGAKAYFLFLNERFINTGVGFGAEAGCQVIKYLLDRYESMEFELRHGVFAQVCTQIETEALEEYYFDFRRNDRRQEFSDGVVFLPTDTWKNFSIHHGTGTWVDGGRDATLNAENAARHPKVKKWLRNPEYFSRIRRVFGRKGEYIYEFLVYDLIDMGPLYFTKRIVKKVRKRARRRLEQ